MSLEALLPPGQRDTWSALKDTFDVSPGNRMSLGGSMVADLSQSEARARCGPWFPSPTRFTRMVSVSKGTLITSRELDSVLGWPVLESSMPKFKQVEHELALVMVEASLYMEQAQANMGIQQLLGPSSFFQHGPTCISNHYFHAQARLTSIICSGGAEWILGLERAHHEQHDRQLHELAAVGCLGDVRLLAHHPPRSLRPLGPALALQKAEGCSGGVGGRCQGLSRRFFFRLRFVSLRC